MELVKDSTSGLKLDSETDLNMHLDLGLELVLEFDTNLFWKMELNVWPNGSETCLNEVIGEQYKLLF